MADLELVEKIRRATAASTELEGSKRELRQAIDEAEEKIRGVPCGATYGFKYKLMSGVWLLVERDYFRARHSFAMSRVLRKREITPEQAEREQWEADNPPISINYMEKRWSPLYGWCYPRWSLSIADEPILSAGVAALPQFIEAFKAHLDRYTNGTIAEATHRRGLAASLRSGLAHLLNGFKVR